MNGCSSTSKGDIVLVVEDESMIRMLLVWELEEAGLTVIEADGADAAVVELGANPFIALVVTDIRMPGSMGWAGAGELDAWPCSRLSYHHHVRLRITARLRHN